MKVFVVELGRPECTGEVLVSVCTTPDIAAQWIVVEAYKELDSNRKWTTRRENHPKTDEIFWVYMFDEHGREVMWWCVRPVEIIEKVV